MHQSQALSANSHRAGQSVEVNLGALADRIIDFLENYGTPYLLGNRFAAAIGSGSGPAKFQRLLDAAGFSSDPDGFCRQVAHHLVQADSSHHRPLQFNGVELPVLLLTELMAEVLPGDRFVGIKDVDQLEQLTNIAVPAPQRADMQAVIDTYPVRLSHHTLRQMRVSRDVAYQYLPFVEELDPVGHTNTWIGQFHQGLLEQMYQNRVIFLLNMSCPVYCRFCFRKHKESRQQTNPGPADVKRAVAHVRQTPTVKEVVITGGDPFLNRQNMAAALDGLMEVPHVQTLRLATRSIAYYPDMFLGNAAALLNYLKMKNIELQLHGKRMEVATHFIHPDEVSIDSLAIISELVSSGIAVYIQTPFLKDCNDQGPELTRLFTLLRGAGAELHYIYIPCSPIHGNSVYWTPISRGHDVARYLRAHLSDRVIPRICTATPIGKMDWYSSGWAVRPDDDPNFIWIRTPYTPDYFKAFAPLAAQPDLLQVNAEGTIDVRYMAKIGDPDLFLGARPLRTPTPPQTDRDGLKRLQAEALQNQRWGGSIVATGSPRVSRMHATRVEVDAIAGPEDLTPLRSAAGLTDVVVAARGDAVEHLIAVGRLIEQLTDLAAVNAVRLRSLMFNYNPGRFTRGVIDRLGRLNRLEIARPLRLEIETQFLHSDEIRPEHQALARALLNRGVTVYSNTPLLAGINDSPDEINRIAYRLREIGVEFHHLYVAGLPLQQFWNTARPVDVADVIDIGTRVRRDGSGREIPRYIIRTPLGEADFGLTARLLKGPAGLRVELVPYDLAYFQRMDPEFEWPAGVTTTAEGHPVVAVSGLTDTGGFMVY